MQLNFKIKDNSDTLSKLKEEQLAFFKKKVFQIKDKKIGSLQI